jgi:Protein of unknown function (DUF3995)
VTTTSTSTAHHRRPPTEGTDRSLQVAAAALAAWSILYVVPHVYWALGGEAGFSLVRPSATRLDDWRLINAIASVVLLVPVLIAWGLARDAQHRRMRVVLLGASLLGAAIAASHGIYGIVYRTLNLAGVVAVDGRTVSASNDPWVLWDLLLFEPWFLIEGLLFVAVGWAAHSTPGGKRRWLLLCLAGVALATVTGLLRLRIA